MRKANQNLKNTLLMHRKERQLLHNAKKQRKHREAMQMEFASICGKHMVLPFIVAEDYFRDYERPVYTATPEQIETYITNNY